MTLDHKAAKKWAEELLKNDDMDDADCERILAACYLDAMAQLKAVRIALGGYPDSDLASLATTLKAQLDKATELLCQIERWERMFDDPDAQTTCAIIRYFLDERKTDDKQS